MVQVDVPVRAGFFVPVVPWLPSAATAVSLAGSAAPWATCVPVVVKWVPPWLEEMAGAFRRVTVAFAVAVAVALGREDEVEPAAAPGVGGLPAADSEVAVAVVVEALGPRHHRPPGPWS